jgi:hypothetical protein
MELNTRRRSPRSSCPFGALTTMKFVGVPFTVSSAMREGLMMSAIRVR